MTVVLDTNVVVAALVVNGLCREVLHRTIRLRAFATSEPLFRELETTLRRKFTVTPATATFLSRLRSSVRFVEPTQMEKPVCRDATDDMVLRTALAAQADAIVTGDDDLLVLRSYAGITIMSPRTFLEKLDGSSGRS